eukprot:CAMPEP_0174371688 /NCGR_PEP_ID=MMETSP0811_2-20130205/100693_1 /TAXON_ID=73025 ORGANISM="Eutreptiella gymnastica-like, Strain CCMP1594" /NCGR_SAMPLE_ID=MMETSP0811_2 /ASSEMBLY_ACC=CAM_ASM_000667 /LENGTH=320 /DNA_ID=CAMNT_0015518311 /DNA_START=53 /DNA_END=1015 /DNA_ORIENTATION=-
MTLLRKMLLSGVVAGTTSYILTPPRAVVGGPNDSLLDIYPLNGTCKLSTGSIIRTPFHAFASGHIIGGSVDYNGTDALVDKMTNGKERLAKTTDGKGIGHIVLFNYQPETQYGSYKEALLCVLVGDDVPQSPTTDPFAYIAALMTPYKQPRLLLLKCWLENVPDSTAMGREVMGIDKVNTHFRYNVSADSTTHFAADGVLSATISNHSKPSIAMIRDTFNAAWSLGPSNFIYSLAQPYTRYSYIYPVGISKRFQGYCPQSEIVSVNSLETTIGAWAPEAGDNLVMGGKTSGAELFNILQFKPQVVVTFPIARYVSTNSIC